MNRIVLSGNVGKRPEARGQQGNIASFSLAVDVRQKGGEKSTMWCKCVAFGKTGESILQDVDQGSFVALGGKMQQREGEQNGVKRTDPEIVGNDELKSLLAELWQEEDEGELAREERDEYTEEEAFRDFYSDYADSME